MTEQLSVAVIGAGMAGRSHANGYRQANTIHGGGLPPIRLAAIADVNLPLAQEVADRYGFEKAVASWQEVAEDPTIDAISIVVGNSLHREIAEAMLAAGKHVLCEKPLAASLEDAEAMVAAAEQATGIAATAYSFRRNPAVEAIRDLLSLSDRPDQSCAAADAIASAQLAAVEARIARLVALKAELERMLVQCAGGVIADCRVIEVLGDHAKCHADHAHAGHLIEVAG